MAIGQMNRVVQHFRRAALVLDGGLTDGQLLERFLAPAGPGEGVREAAFEAILRRHGTMVLGVCRRMLRNEHDAEDACQATFLVLVRKAGSLRRIGAVANWLYGVAYHTALKARAQTLKRRVKETQVRHMAKQEERSETDGHDWQPLLDQELSRLPDKLREAVVLCDLQGQTRRQAARHVGVPEGTFSGRLSSAHRILAQRLTRRGVTLSAGGLAALLFQGAAQAGMSGPLVSSTVKAATLLVAGQTATGVISAKVACLSEGVLKAMLMTKLKVTAGFLLVVGLVVAGAGLLAHRSLAATPPEATVTTAAFAPQLVEDEALVPVAQRGKTEKKDGVRVAGQLKEVDADKNSVTITTPPTKRGEAPGSKTYDVAKDAKIQADGTDVKLSALKKGGKAMLVLSADEKTVVSINVTSPGTTAPLKAVDVGGSTITVTVGNRMAKEDKTLKVSKDAKIMIDGKEGKLADLKTGLTISFSTDDANNVVQIRAAIERKREREEE